MLATSRLELRVLAPQDASFILALFNEPDFVRFIGDRGLRTLEDAERYVHDGPMVSETEHGFSLWCVTARESAVALGICGLVKRPDLPDVDLGFAFLSAHRGKGYAREAATGVVAHAFSTLGLPRLAAIVLPENARSLQLLGELGFRYERLVQRSPKEPVLEYHALTRLAPRAAS